MPANAKSDTLIPTDHAESVALFRSEIIGALCRRDLDHGELAAELRALSQRRYRPPGADATRRYSVPTLERWLYRYKTGGLLALRPKVRSDKGRRIACERLGVTLLHARPYHHRLRLLHHHHRHHHRLRTLHHRSGRDERRRRGAPRRARRRGRERPAGRDQRRFQRGFGCG